MIGGRPVERDQICVHRRDRPGYRVDRNPSEGYGANRARQDSQRDFSLRWGHSSSRTLRRYCDETDLRLVS